MKLITMKRLHLQVLRQAIGPLALTVLLCAGGAAKTLAAEEEPSAAAAAGSAEGNNDAGEAKNENRNKIVIQRIEPREARVRKEVAWLGVGVEEVGDALASQLGLQSGEGLVVTYVEPDSPAAKAGIKKNDVLVQFDKQMMVDPAQLRKLVQMHKSGDTVRLELFRGGKKETVEATLSKTRSSLGWMQDERAWHGDMTELHRQLEQLKGQNMEALQKQMKTLHESLKKAGVDHDAMSMEIRRSIEEARRAADAAVHQASNELRNAGNLKLLQDLAHKGVDIDKDSTVIIKRNDQSVQTQVKADETGSYVIVANPTKRLTAHDQHGKLLFDGEIETPEQQAKVPKDVWEKVEPMLKEMGKGEAEETK